MPPFLSKIVTLILLSSYSISPKNLSKSPNVGLKRLLNIIRQNLLKKKEINNLSPIQNV